MCQERDIAFIREDLVALLAQSRDGLLRVKHIVQNLKDFSRMDQAQWQVANLNDVITVRTGRGGNGPVPDQWGWVEVQDTGCGIAQHQMNRLFEPFYTTKVVGQGQF